MSESGDYQPAPWAATHDFKSARALYDKHAGRSYADATAANVKAGDLVPASIKTESGHPLLIRCDVSGSMGGWPNTIFEKLGYFDHELRTEYMSDDVEVSFGAISDTSDEYPLQVQPFVRDKGLQEALKKLVITGGGSGPGDYCEAHAVSAVYDLHNVHMPQSLITPPLIIITDEKPYDHVSKTDAKEFAKATIGGALTATAIYAKLMKRYSVYVIQKPYGDEHLRGDTLSGVTKRVHDRWMEIVGVERIALLPEARRVVDVIFGILAAETGRIDYFRKEIEARQQPGQVKQVYEALTTVHQLSPGNKSVKKLPPGGSTLHPRDTNRKS
jgi:hypothetical protein